MSALTKLASLMALGTTILPAMFFYIGLLDHSVVQWLALGGTLVWFAVTPLWMGRQREMKDEAIVP